MPTPQFAPVLDRLAQDRQIHPIEVKYLRSDDGGRGWGEIQLRHVHAFVHARGLHGFSSGLKLGFSGRMVQLVCFGYSTPYAMGALLGARFRRVPVFTQSDSSFRQHLERPKIVKLAKRILISTLFARDTRVWTIGDDNAAFWSAHGLHNQRRVPFESPVSADTSDVLARVPILNRPSGGEATVLYVGRLASIKRVNDAVQAVALAREAGHRMRMLVVGDGDMEVLKINGSIPSWLTCLGALPHADLGAAYATSDVLILASEYEPYGLVVREALQFGLPVVASCAVTAARELCDHGWNVVDVGDVTGLSKALARATVSQRRWPEQQPIAVDRVYASELELRAEGTQR